MCRKNKPRKYICSLCGHRELNIYYGYKHYDEFPLVLYDYYHVFETKCKWCGNETYYTVKKMLEGKE